MQNRARAFAAPCGGQGVVVKLNVNGAAITLPERSFTLLTEPLTTVLGGKPGEGVKTAVAPLTAIVPEMPGESTNAVFVTLAESTFSENVTVTAAVVGTLVAPFTGFTAATVGGVRSLPPPPPPQHGVMKSSPPDPPHAAAAARQSPIIKALRRRTNRSLMHASNRMLPSRGYQRDMQR
jgi:hypothetical protein